MLIFPAIDLLEGSAVRLAQGKRDSAKIYSREPWEIAKAWSKLGIPRLHVVDLDAAFARAAGSPKPGANNRDVIRKIIETSKLEVEVGGGVRTLEDCEALFDVGVKHVVLGTAAVKDPVMVREACAQWPNRIVVAVDAREGKVSVEGWTEDTSADAVEVGLAVARAGAGAVLYTDIGRDGHGIARVAQLLEPYAFLDAPVGDVEAGDDAFAKHCARSARVRGRGAERPRQ